MSTPIDTSAGTPSASPRPRARFRQLRIACIVVAVLDGIFLIGWTASVLLWHESARAAVEAEKQKIRERGEPVSFSELKPAPVPPEQDGTALLLEALEKYQAPDVIGFYEFYNRYYALPQGDALAHQPTGPETNDFVVQAVAANSESVRLLRAAASMTHCQLPLDYNEPTPWDVLLPHRQTIRYLVEVPHAEIVDALARGEGVRAVKAAHVMLDASEVLEEEVTLVGQLVRYALGRKAVDAVSYIAANHQLSEEERESLDARFVAIDATNRVRQTFLADRAMLITQVETCVARCENLDGEAAPITIKPVLLDQLTYYLRWLERLLPHVDQVGPRAEMAIGKLEMEAEQARAPEAILTRLFAPAIHAGRNAAMSYRQVLIHGRLALRIDRHYRQTGALPETLDEVLDESLPSIPPCVFSGRPPVYRKLTSGFAIYDMGADLKDDQVRTRDVHERTTLVKVVYPSE
jgi:hypothetical protein